ncbi:Lrp/AsnC family transcriptional regulator [Streptomyces griseoaurantiacus]|jgi:DNA-binding Lrp family transcriptional regulator|uniref:Lrp/AsnC family transcriptional regulator n=2 Tax=Streptomyces TaxID=1883 RepID=UPI00362B2AAC
MPVDQLDTRILRLLLEQPRTSVREYARVLGIARGTLQARLDRLERDGVITGTAPSLSPAALGHPVLAFVHVEVTQGRLDEVGDALAEVPEIVEAFSTTGGGDLLTRVVARDNAHLEDLVQTLISIPGVVRTRTEVALRERVRYRLLPLVAAVGRAAGPTPGQGTGGGGPTGPGTGGGGPTGPGTGGAGPGGGRG